MAVVTCPYCGGKIDVQDDVMRYCSHCGSYLSEDLIRNALAEDFNVDDPFEQAYYTEQKKKFPVKILIIVIVILALLAAGIAAYFVLFREEDPSHVSESSISAFSAEQAVSEQEEAPEASLSPSPTAEPSPSASAASQIGVIDDEPDVSAEPDTHIPTVVPKTELEPEFDTIQDAMDHEFIDYPLEDGGSISIFMVDYDVTLSKVLDAAEDATGVHLDITSVSRNAAEDQFNLMIASGDWTDLLPANAYYYGNGTTERLQNAMEDDVIVDFGDFIEFAMPNYYAVVNMLDSDTKDTLLDHTLCFWSYSPSYGDRPSTIASRYSISTCAVDVEMIMNWQNYFWTTEGSILADFGVEGVSYQVNPDGSMSLLEDAASLVTSDTLYYDTMSPIVGYYALTSWINENGNWYFRTPQGRMQTGFGKIGDTWYFFDTSGVLQTGWLEYNGNTYYLDENGARVTGEQIIDGKTYSFDEQGVLQEQ